MTLVSRDLIDPITAGLSTSLGSIPLDDGGAFELTFNQDHYDFVV